MNFSKIYSYTNSGNKNWEYQVNGVTDVVIDKEYNKYFIENDHNVAVLDQNKNKKWTFATGGPCFNTIADNKTIYVGSFDGYIYAVNTDGSLKWYLNTGSAIIQPPVINKDGTLYVVNKKGYLYAIKTNASGLADSPWPMYGHDVRNTNNYNTKIK